MREIRLSSGDLTKVSDEDFDYLNQFHWHLNHDGYAQRTEGRNPNRKTVRMNRIVALREGKVIKGLEVDHRDRNKLNNQRENLIPSTLSQNRHNVPPKINSATGVSGVSRYRNGKYKATLYHNDVTLHLGYYDTYDEAVARRHLAEKEYGIYKGEQ